MAWECQRDSEVTKWHWYSAREMAPRQRPTTGTIGFLRRFFGLFSSAEQHASERRPSPGRWGGLAHHQATGSGAPGSTQAPQARMNAFGKQKAKAPHAVSEGHREAESQGRHLQTRLRGQCSVREGSDTLLYSPSGSTTLLPSSPLPPGTIS